MMGVWQVMYARASASQFLPHNSAALQFQALVSIQMDAEFLEEQIGTLFAWIRALGGGLGGWGVPRWGPAQKVYMPSEKFSCLLLTRTFIF